MLACIGLSGFAALAYEVLWTRALLRYLYNSTYAFTTMLATFLMGIAVGSAVYAAWLRRSRRPLLVFAVLQLFVGLGFVASGLAFEELGRLSASEVAHATIRSFAESVATMFVRAGSILFLPTRLPRRGPAARHGDLRARTRDASATWSAVSTPSTRSARSSARWSPASC